MLRLTSGGVDGELDFDISDEILSVIPTDPFEQLDLARRITSMAIASRVSNLEDEVVGLRQKLHEKERVTQELEEKASRLERDFRDADSRLKIVLDDNMNLTKERHSLAMTAKKLSRDFAKMEAFKRQLIQSLSDDNASQTEPIDIGTCEQSSVPVSFADKASRYSTQRFSMTPYISPQFTPTGTPKIVSTTGSPRGYSAAGSPKKTSGSMSPTKLHYEGKTKAALWYPSSQQSSAANSPPRRHPIPARTPRMDGKEFFRQARSRLSYEQFSAFLANIKELNAQKQTREETLKKAEEILGMDNQDLYLSFQGLLNRNVR